MQIYNRKRWISYNINFIMCRDGSLVVQIFIFGMVRSSIIQTCRDRTDHMSR